MSDQQPNESSSYLWVDKILPGIDIDFEYYSVCEHDVITPALIAAGYELIGVWRTFDGDSFGPLTRGILTNRGTVIYG